MTNRYLAILNELKSIKTSNYKLIKDRFATVEAAHPNMIKNKSKEWNKLKYQFLPKPIGMDEDGKLDENIVQQYMKKYPNKTREQILGAWVS